MGISYYQALEINKTENLIIGHIYKGCNWDFGLQRALNLKPGKVYGTLRRLERQGYVTSEYKMVENRMRRVYQLTDTGMDRIK